VILNGCISAFEPIPLKYFFLELKNNNPRSRPKPPRAKPYPHPHLCATKGESIVSY